MKETGKNTVKVLLAIINAYYDDQNGYSHCSATEINKKYGLAKNSISKMFVQLEKDGWIEDCTISGYYKRFRILKPYPCPVFILSRDLSNTQKNFLLKCLETDVNKDLSKKEMARRIYNSETNNNVKRMLDSIENSSGNTVFQILDNVDYISGVIPEDAEYSEFGYRTILNKKERTLSETENDKIAKYLYKKSLSRFKKTPNIREYNLTEDYVKELLLKQNYKDYYTGIKPDSYLEYSLDRVDSSKGYTQGNIVITTSIINIMKNDLSTEEFKNQIKLLYNNIDNF